MEKKIIVRIVPPCISINREMQYIEQVEQAYKQGTLAIKCPKAKIVEETADKVVIQFNR